MTDRCHSFVTAAVDKCYANIRQKQFSSQKYYSESKSGPFCCSLRCLHINTLDFNVLRISCRFGSQVEPDSSFFFEGLTCRKIFAIRNARDKLDSDLDATMCARFDSITS